MSNTKEKLYVTAEDLTTKWWHFAITEEIDSTEKLRGLDMDDIFHLIRVIYTSYIPLVVSDFYLENGKIFVTFAKKYNAKIQYKIS